MLAGRAHPVDETGHVEGFDIRLKEQPAHDVTVVIATSDPTELLIAHEGSVAQRTQLVFDQANWDLFVHVEYEGIDDYLVDGDQDVRVVFNVTSSDQHYNLQ